MDFLHGRCQRIGRPWKSDFCELLDIKIRGTTRPLPPCTNDSIEILPNIKISESNPPPRHISSNSLSKQSYFSKPKKSHKFSNPLHTKLKRKSISNFFRFKWKEEIYSERIPRMNPLNWNMKVNRGEEGKGLEVSNYWDCRCFIIPSQLATPIL